MARSTSHLARGTSHVPQSGMHAHSRADSPSHLSTGLTIAGELSSDHDLAIEGTFDGQILLPEQHLTIAASARVKAKITARAVTVAGQLEGTITATERVHLERGASVQGHLQTPTLLLADG